MYRPCLALAITVAIALAPVSAADARGKKSGVKPPPRPPVIVRDPSLYRPPPPPHDRSYYGPAPSIQPPMQRVPLPAPLAQPPIR